MLFGVKVEIPSTGAVQHPKPHAPVRYGMLVRSPLVCRRVFRDHSKSLFTLGILLSVPTNTQCVRWLACSLAAIHVLHDGGEQRDVVIGRRPQLELSCAARNSGKQLKLFQRKRQS
jgi:hypothetical protein